jgi:dihydroflavonol-4-reductase
MKAFVTGSTGFVGSHVARLLAEQGAELRLLVRKTSRTDLIDGIRAERITGDLTNPDSLKQGMAGCDAVFHVAADYRLWIPDPDSMYKANVEGTRAIIQAAQETGVKRVVYTSSVATMGFASDGSICDENSPVSEAEMIGHYKRSKFLAEQVALAAGKSGAPVVVVNPTAPIGEQDIKPTPTGRIVLDFLKGKFPAYVDTGLNVVDVREVAFGHVQAFERAKPGERYILGGENLTLKQLLDKLAAISGIPSPTKKVPHGVALGFAYLDEFFTGRVMKKEPRATVDAVRMGKKKMWASSAKAEHELGWRTVPIDDALHRACGWFVAHGYVELPKQVAHA